MKTFSRFVHENLEHQEGARRVFLGGTCNGSKWRDDLTKILKIEYFNPVVKNWNDEARQEELRQREICDHCLYVITPLMSGCYSIAELVDDSCKRPTKTIFTYLIYDTLEDKIVKFDDHQIKSLEMVAKMIGDNGATFLPTLEDVSKFLNGEYSSDK